MRWIALCVLACATMAAAETKSGAEWVGVWQAELDGETGLVVTLGNDSGNVGGTIVFNIVARDKEASGSRPHILGRDAHFMNNLRVDGDTLTFEVFRQSDGRDLHLKIQRKSANSANFECDECGRPTMELLRIN